MIQSIKWGLAKTFDVVLYDVLAIDPGKIATLSINRGLILVLQVTSKPEVVEQPDSCKRWQRVVE